MLLIWVSILEQEAAPLAEVSSDVGPASQSIAGQASCCDEQHPAGTPSEREAGNIVLVP
jgi:hypothetical protein